MESWELDFEWLKVRHYIKSRMGNSSLPDLEAILLLIGIQESNVIKSVYSKEEKQDLMHIATCELLSKVGYFEFVGKDDEGWPHYEQVKLIAVEGAKKQESLLKECIVEYFDLQGQSIETYEN